MFRVPYYFSLPGDECLILLWKTPFIFGKKIYTLNVYLCKNALKIFSKIQTLEKNMAKEGNCLLILMIVMGRCLLKISLLLIHSYDCLYSWLVRYGFFWFLFLFVQLFICYFLAIYAKSESSLECMCIHLKNML